MAKKTIARKQSAANKSSAPASAVQPGPVASASPGASMPQLLAAIGRFLSEGEERTIALCTSREDDPGSLGIAVHGASLGAVVDLARGLGARILVDESRAVVLNAESGRVLAELDELARGLVEVRLSA